VVFFVLVVLGFSFSSSTGLAGEVVSSVVVVDVVVFCGKNLRTAKKIPTATSARIKILAKGVSFID
jgi:hypothetical protein